MLYGVIITSRHLIMRLIFFNLSQLKWSSFAFLVVESERKRVRCRKMSCTYVLCPGGKLGGTARSSWNFYGMFCAIVGRCLEFKNV